MPDASFEIPADANLTLSMEGGVAGQVVNNLTTTDAGFALDARQGRILNEAKLDKSAVDNSLTTTEAGRVLDARQGKWLAENKVGFGDVENTLNSTDSSRVLSAAQGKVLNDRIDELYEMPDGFPAAKRDLSNVDVVNFYEKAAAAGVSLPIATATSTNGVDYAVTVPGVKTIPRGYMFVLVPSVASTGTRLTLNVNGIGAKTIRRLLSSTSNNAVSTVTVGYFSATRPVIVQYDSYTSSWVVVGGAKPSADDLHGTLPLAKGGTGATTADAARTAIGAAPASHKHSAGDVDTGTLPLVRGGTGASTAKEAEFNICGGISEMTDTIVDEHPLVFARTSPAATSGVFYKRSVSKLWDYIAGKIRGVFGFSSSNVLPVKNGGTGATTAVAARANIGAVAMTTARFYLQVADWGSNLQQTVSVSGVTADSNVIVSPSAGTHEAYHNAMVRCSAQADGTLTFTASEIPASRLFVYALILK